MALALTTTFAFCLWIVLWAVGIKGFDGILVALLIVLLGATLRAAMRFLPGASK
jgi:hypothetical protein